MSLVALAVLWGVITAVLIVLLIYRSTLTMQEDDQLYLSESESHMQKQQTEILTRVNKINPVVRLLGAGSALLFLVVAGMWTYQMLSTAR
jgi:Tfp pilus assembly protein PilN